MTVADESLYFEIEGLVNSFKNPSTSAFQFSYLIPPKTSAVGLLTNVAGWLERDYYQLLNVLDVAVVPLHIEARFSDLWSVKKWKASNLGKDILFRERLFKSRYAIYVKISNQRNTDAKVSSRQEGKGRNHEKRDLTAYMGNAATVSSTQENGESANLPRGLNEKQLLDLLERSLRQPFRIPALGLDDELVVIRNVEIIKLQRVAESTIVDSIATFEGTPFRQDLSGISRGTAMIPARVSSIPINYDISRIPRVTKYLEVIEFLGGRLKFEHPKKQLFKDTRKENERFLEFF